MANSQFFSFNTNTLLLLLIITFIVYLYIFNVFNKLQYLTKKNLFNENQQQIIKIVETPRINLNHKVNLRRVMDPLEPPERTYPLRRAIPINIPTRGRSGPYQQVGTLTRQTEGQDALILPLYGKPTYPGSNQWLYYTSSNAYNSIKISINHKNKNCQKHYGCQEIYDGDEITVPSYQGTFIANLYEIDAPRYIPHIY